MEIQRNFHSIMKTFSTIRLVLACASLPCLASADTIFQTVGTYSQSWGTTGPGAAFSDPFQYALFDPSLGTLNSVQFCVTLKGTGDWIADYGGEGSGTVKTLDLTFTGGQAFDVDGGLGWLGAGFNPVVDNIFVTDTVNVTGVQVPFWIMSPDDGPSFAWGGQYGFDLTNTSAFIGTGTDTATFSTYGLFNVTSNPAVSIAAEGQHYEWAAELQVKYNFTPVPEPGSALLVFACGMATLIRRPRARRRQA